MSRAAFRRFLAAPSTRPILDRMLADNAAVDVRLASVHPLHAGICVCGVGVALHFDEGRRVSCNEAKIRAFMFGDPAGEAEQHGVTGATDTHLAQVTFERRASGREFRSEGR